MTGMKRQASQVLALLMLIFVLVPTALAQQMVSVDRPEINMRSGAGTNHEALWRLNRGYPLKVTGRQGDWLKVSDFEGDVGWVHRPLTGNTPHFVVKSTTANIRSGPGTQHRVVGKAEYGEVLRTLERRAKWARIRTAAGLTGWVSRSLLWGW